MTTPIPPRIWTYQDGDVHRIADDKGRRYTVEGLWESESDPMSPHDRRSWDKRTSFTEREAIMLVDVLKREQTMAEKLDRIAGGIAAFEDAITAAKAWRSRRQDG